MSATFSDETLARILSSAFPPPSLVNGDAYERRWFLLESRMVCKQWRRVADQVRFEHLCLFEEEASLEEEEVLKSGEGGVGRYVRTVEGEAGTLDRTRRVLDKTPQVTRLFVQDCVEERESVDAGFFEGLDGLRHLHLDGLEVTGIFFPLPSLTTLTLTEVASTEETLPRLLSPRTTPNLCAVFFSDISRADDPEAMEGELDQPLLPYVLSHSEDLSRLDVLQIGCSNGFIEAPRSLFRSGPHILVSFSPSASRLPQVMGSGYPPSADSDEDYADYDPRCHEPPWWSVSPSVFKLPRHLHLDYTTSPFPRDWTSFERGLKRLTDLLSSSSATEYCPLRTLSFPVLPPTPDDEPSALVLDALFRVCRRIGIKVIMVEPREREVLCEAFWRWAREHPVDGGASGGDYLSTSEEEEARESEEEEEEEEDE